MENQTTTTRTALKWGVILGVVFIVYNVVIWVSGQIGNQTFTYLTYPILAAGIYFAMKEFREENQGFMSYGQGLGLGTMQSAVIGIISGLFSFAYMKFIDTSLPDQMMKIAQREMEKKGTPDDQIEQAMEMTKMFMTPGALFAFTVLGMVFLGFVFSLIISAILKKEKPVFQ
jgi:Protein of unknown function (DUF4199)